MYVADFHILMFYIPLFECILPSAYVYTIKWDVVKGCVLTEI